MKLRELSLKIDKTILNEVEFKEVEKRVNQIKTLCLIDSFEVVIEMVANALQMYYICVNNDVYDIIQEFNLEESIETGHITIVSF